MSQTAIAEDIRLRLAQSMPEVDPRRGVIARRMQERLQEFETPEDSGKAEITAMLLVEMLVNCASDLAAFGGVRNLEEVACKHRRLDMDGRHYSRFGLLLGPVLRDVLGVRLPPKTASAWCDAFWYIIRQMSPQEAVEPRYG
ncbi:MAG TPA: globin [Allosphingosinicella sp.]|nr:globin [Allosphingosinicella sp.]